MLRKPLWSGASYPHVNNVWENIHQTLLDQGTSWGFWIEWYENALNGLPQDYDLLTKIALIDPKDWDKGASHVNALIVEIIVEQKKSHSNAPARVTTTMIKRVQLSVQDNGPVLALQLGALLAVADHEIVRIRSSNSLDPVIRANLLAALNKLKEAATEILTLLPDAGRPPVAEAEQIAGWGVVMKDQAIHWNTEAKKIVQGLPADDRVARTGRLVLAATVAGTLSLAGLGSFATIAGGYILLGGKLDIPKAIDALKSGTTPP